MSARFHTPPFAAWRHGDAREGFEVVFLDAGADGLRAEGHTAALEDGEPFAVGYAIELDARWHTRSARVAGRSRRGSRTVTLEADGEGRWSVDGHPAPHLDGCLDVDLESSCVTNALPVHRLELGVGEAADAPAAYVRARDLTVERLEQRYTRLEDVDGAQRYRYAAPAFEFECDLAYDRAGLVLAYPGIGRRVA
jgi:uncharacterized protein